MKKLRVGVWVSNSYNPQSGGAYGYYYQLINKIETYDFKNAEIVFLSNSDEILKCNFKRKHHIQWTPYKQSRIEKLLNFVANKLRIKYRDKLNRKMILAHEQKLKDELNQHVDIIYYPTPMCEYPNFPYVYTLWDLGYLSMYAFPEVSMNGVFEERKNSEIFPCKALMIFSESEAGKKNIVKYLHINESRIKVIPLFPSELVTVSISPIQPKNIEKDLLFIHYPAQYWAHKNHFNLLIALKQVIENFPSLKLVLTGSDKGNKPYINQIISELGLKDQVVDLGFVSVEELKWLYLNSQGLVMPTFLGPTNMPLVEAAELGCPVACSKLDGHMEQLGNYGYYFDPKNHEEIATVICEMLKDKVKDVRRPYVSTFNIDNAINAIDEAFTELRNIRFCWGAKDEIY